MEWGFLTVLSPLARQPKLLHRQLARDPAFFAKVLEWVFPAEGGEPRDLTPEEAPAWSRAYQLLDAWRLIPGTGDGNTINPDVLQKWVRQARDLARASGRLAAADRIIGQVLGAAPPEPDGTWPCKVVRDVIEEVESPDLERGFRLAVFNSRGTITKGATEGGIQERALGGKYESLAAQIVDGSQRTARVLRAIADDYRTDALREDQRAQFREDLYGW